LAGAMHYPAVTMAIRQGATPISPHSPFFAFFAACPP
jgi:hypothetical protein